MNIVNIDLLAFGAFQKKQSERFEPKVSLKDLFIWILLHSQTKVVWF